MPYATIDELPPVTRHLPEHAQEIFRAAFNNAWDEYGGDEETAFRVAWSAVKKRSRKRGESRNNMDRHPGEGRDPRLYRSVTG